MVVTLDSKSPLPLNHYLTEVPKDQASSARNWAQFYYVIEKICWVAMSCIALAVLATSYTNLPLFSPLALFLMTLSTVFIGLGISRFKILSNQYYNLAKSERQVAHQLKKIQNWSPLQIKQFLRNEGIDPSQISLENLRQINRGKPLKALLPLIARYLFLKESARFKAKESQEDLTFKIERQIQIMEDLKGPLKPNRKRGARLYLRESAYEKLEQEAYPKALEASLILRLLQTPQINLTLKDLGSFQAKTYQERMFDRNYQPINDNYFAFKETLKRNPISLREVEQCVNNDNFSGLRDLIFP